MNLIAARAVALLSRTRIELDTGLEDDELDEIELRSGFTFLPEHRDFLGAVLPVGDDWPDWRGGGVKLTRLLEHPVCGILDHVAAGDFWYAAWGQRPSTIDAAVELAERRLNALPKLVPVHAYCYLPSAPDPTGSPVFSIFGTDVVYFGVDLEEYFDNAIIHPFNPRPQPENDVRVPFWSDLAEGSERDFMPGHWS